MMGQPGTPSQNYEPRWPPDRRIDRKKDLVRQTHTQGTTQNVPCPEASWTMVFLFQAVVSEDTQLLTVK